MTLIYAEDLRVGERRELGSYHLTAQDLDSFARQWDPQDHHIDSERATAGVYGGVIASGLHSLAILQRLSVINMLNDVAVIAGRELGPVRFVRPVRAGTTLVGTAQIDAVEFDDRHRALVSMTGRLSDESTGKTLVEVGMSFYAHARSQRPE
ncbi:dehydratase [Gordonia sp. TBRC 11910]|uniref:Dehydratase n=1 Tax=Gordonia asplenii TaxID=2725283 RepID=A0A848L080_9ACTN|nr:MaoC/PaaZ C-terminal domain-containing protein [Gordonia asplenii]NMO04089.1 dehydratase [Gordonia asplenii]